MGDGYFGGAFEGRRVLVTGHTGFKGSWLSYWLLEMGAEVTGFALEPDTDPSLFRQLGLESRMDSRIGDIRDRGSIAELIVSARPEAVLHLAAQPLVRRSYAEPVYTFETNVMGTVNLLDACSRSDAVRAVVNVTTDKVYENAEHGRPFVEGEALGGHDPYSASKACSELVSAAYRSSFFIPAKSIACSTARGGNVIGGGDWAQDRIVSDIARALQARQTVLVRNPNSVRPWQHVLEPLSGYLTLIAAMLGGAAQLDRAYNFGPLPTDTRTVSDLVERAVAAWGDGNWETAAEADAPHEAGLLRLDIGKAGRELSWGPVWRFDTAVDRTIEWYKRVAQGASPEEVTVSDLAAYTADAKAAGHAWPGSA